MRPAAAIRRRMTLHPLNAPRMHMLPLLQKAVSRLLPASLKTIAALFVLGLSALHAQEVELFSPQGEVKAVRQVTARFARPMVPFGDPREVDPFAIDCVEKGKG